MCCVVLFLVYGFMGYFLLLMKKVKYVVKTLTDNFKYHLI